MSHYAIALSLIVHVPEIAPTLWRRAPDYQPPAKDPCPSVWFSDWLT